MSVTMDGIYIDGQKTFFKPEDILSGDTSDYTQEITDAVTDWLDENVSGGETLAVDSTLSISDAAADAKVTGDEIDRLREDLKDTTTESPVDFFADRYIDLYAPVTNNGITFTNIGDGGFSAQGTASAAAYRGIYSKANLPSWMKPGEPLRIYVTTTSTSGLRFMLGFYDANDVQIGSWQYISRNRTQIVPTDAVKVSANIQVPSGTVFNTAQTIYVKIYRSIYDLQAFDELNDLINYNAFNAFGNVPTNGASNNAITWTIDNGQATAAGSTTSTTPGYKSLYDNTSVLPSWMVPGKKYYVKYSGTNVELRIYDSSLNRILSTTQDTEFTVPSNLTGCVIRLYVDVNKNNVNETVKLPAFLNTKSNADIVAEFESLPKANGVLANNTDLDTMTTAGQWLKDSARTYTHDPVPNKDASLEVVNIGNCILQRLSRYDGNGIWYRLSTTQGSFADRDWHVEGNVYNNTYTTNQYENTYDITCSPTITTDTNNYLASTGDTTDRTGDIQTMLNTTGVCHLGPGDFYVTGVEIPRKGAIIGSGINTRIVLASSVTNGYAIKLNNYCTVKDLYIDGLLSGSPSSTVGTRHGILYQGTATDWSDPASARRYYGIIDGLQIENLSGAGIMCTGTGGQINSNLLVSNCHIRTCGAGIDVAYYSEFHRFTNISASNCYYGCICNGGNCNFVNCSFSRNMIGVLMDNATGQSLNNSHGVFSACTVCHSGSDNDGIAIKILNCDIGEIFTGMQIHYGSVVVDDSKAIRFVGCQFGQSVPMTLTDNTLITFSDCSMSDASAPTVTQSGNTTIAFDRCYKYDGTAFNPMVP